MKAIKLIRFAFINVFLLHLIVMLYDNYIVIAEVKNVHSNYFVSTNGFIGALVVIVFLNTIHFALDIKGSD